MREDAYLLNGRHFDRQICSLQAVDVSEGSMHFANSLAWGRSRTKSFWVMATPIVRVGGNT